jgi:ornithine cyclodeaminase/alanine dehydrogenase-like protein (mu-crystallin family)
MIVILENRQHDTKAEIRFAWVKTQARRPALPWRFERRKEMESWRNRKTLILSRTEMMGLLTPAEYNGCVEQAYRMHGERRFYMDPKSHIVLDKYPGEWEAMPSYIEEPEAAACKWVSIRERNREKHDLPTGRTSDKDITLFDSTGIALQDSATIPLEYGRAVAAGVGIEKKMIST